MGERLFLEEDTKTLHTLHPSVIIIGERIKSIREEIDDDVNDDKERRQKRMRGEEEETAPVRRALFFKTHTHTHIYISIGVGVVFFFFLQCLSDENLPCVLSRPRRRFHHRVLKRVAFF